MAAIVAFGDSNTWGYDPATGRRFPPATRWTGVMATELGPSHHIIEEGLNGRTTVFDDPLDAGRRGADYLGPCLRSHAPFELLILALGCNDMKARFNVGAGEIAAGVERLVAMAQTEGGLKVLLVAPPPVAKLTAFAEQFRGAEAKSRELAARYAEVAERRGIGFVDAGQFIACSDLDGIHYEADQHAVLGRALAEAVGIVLE